MPTYSLEEFPKKGWKGDRWEKAAEPKKWKETKRIRPGANIQRAAWAAGAESAIKRGGESPLIGREKRKKTQGTENIQGPVEVPGSLTGPPTHAKRTKKRGRLTGDAKRCRSYRANGI